MEDNKIIQEFADLKSAICIQTKLLQELKLDFKELRETVSKEHDKTLSLEMDVSNFQGDFQEQKEIQKECRKNCDRRKSDLTGFIDEKIKEATSKSNTGIMLWVYRALVTALLAVSTFFIINFFINPVQTHIQEQTKK
jgi:hypothetical protein